MKRLFEGRLDPITFKIGFLEAPPERVSDAFLARALRTFPEAKVQRVSGRCEELLLLLEPLTIPPYRDLLIRTRSGWTAYFQNHLQSADIFMRISSLAEELGCRGVIAGCRPEIDGSPEEGVLGTLGCIEFELFGPFDTDFFNLIRLIRVWSDRKWTFETFGAALPFEDVQQYRKRRVTDRFTPEMLDSYCWALGIRLNDDEFYLQDGWLRTIIDGTPPQVRQLSLMDARREQGLPAVGDEQAGLSPGNATSRGTASTLYP